MNTTNLITVFVHKGTEKVEAIIDDVVFDETSLSELEVAKKTITSYVQELMRVYPTYQVSVVIRKDESEPETVEAEVIPGTPTPSNVVIVKRLKTHYSRAQQKLIDNLDTKAYDYLPPRVRSGKTDLTVNDVRNMRVMVATDTVVKVGGSIAVGVIFGKSYVAIAGLAVGTAILYEFATKFPKELLADKVLIHKGK